MKELLKFWDNMQSPRVLVVGDIILDSYTWGDAERVSPEAPVLVLKADTQEVRLGGAASVANLLRALDVEVTLAGVIGDDASGRTVRRLLDEAGIDSTLVVCDGSRPTTKKARFIGRAEGKQPHHVLRVDEESGDLLTTEVQHQLAELIVGRLTEFDAILISDYAKGVCRCMDAKTTRSVKWREAARWGDSSSEISPESNSPSYTFENELAESILLKTIIQTANGRGVPVLVDPARINDVECYRGATLLKPNRIEAELFAGVRIDSPTAAIRVGESLCGKLGLQAALITLDRDGMVLSQPGAPSELFPTTLRAVCDITGAGDTAFALLGLVIANTVNGSPAKFKSTISNAVRLANIASGLQVERFGVTPINRGEIRAEIRRQGGAPPGKMAGLDELQTIAEKCRCDRKTVVFTNGCFDLLHVGHVAMLEESAQLGDVLIVAINSDESVRRFKGADRPVIRQQDRARMLASLECVDHVLIFNDETPHRLLDAIRPDILVKGGTTAEIVGHELVERYGGRVHKTGQVPAISTTLLISQLRAPGSKLQEVAP